MARPKSSETRDPAATPVAKTSHLAGWRIHSTPPGSPHLQDSAAGHPARPICQSSNSGQLPPPWPRRHAAPSGRLCRQPQPLGRRRRAACGYWSLACICARPLARRLCVPANPPDEIAPGVVAAGNNFKVVVRVRPPLPRELSGDKRFQNIARIDRDRTITLCENLVRPASGSCVTL